MFNKGKATLIQFPAGRAGHYSIPDAVSSIEWGAFDWCPNLTSVTIPKSVASTGVQQFRRCTNLVDITVDALNPAYSSLDGVLFNRSLTTLIRCPRGKAGAYVIPPTVASLGLESLYGCTGLSSVAIPDSVTSIGWSAFAGCTGLTEITIPDSVTSIGYFSFQGCTGLTGITIPDGVTSIEFYSFHGCTGLTAVKIGEGVNTIQPVAFAGCTGLTSITIPDNVTTIGWEAFDNCSALTHVWIGSGVNSIDSGAFNGVHLAAIDVDALNTVYSSLDGVLFNRIQTALLQYPGLKAVGYVIPDGVTSIGYYAFGGCTGLASVTIPDSVTSIGPAAFAGCTSLTGITFPASVTAIADSAFWGCTSLSAVYFEGDAPGFLGQRVFEGTSATIYYLPGTSGWGATFGGRPTMPRGVVWGGPVRGDVDGDDVVDRNDLDLVVASRNRVAVNSEDPRDLDGDGRITVLDARILVTLFSVPGGLLHAASSPEGVVLEWAESAGAVKLQSTSDLGSGLWEDVGELQSSTNAVVDGTAERLFFRLVLPE